VRLCRTCADDWHEYGLVDREPLISEVPTEYVDGEWVFPGEAEPEAVVTYTTKPSRGTGSCGTR